MPTKRLVDEGFHKPRVRASSRRAITNDKESNQDSSSQDHPASHKVQDENSNLVYDLHDEDVISTNGGSHMLPHPGNVRFVQMSVAYGKRYHVARSEQCRFAVVQDFIQAFQGRFVKHLGNGVYRKLPHGSVIQKVTRALKRATFLPKARNEADNKANSVPMPKRTRCKLTAKNKQVELLPTSKEARRQSETLLGRKRRRVSRFFQHEHEASVAPTTRVVKTTADIVVGPTPAKRTSSSRVQDVPPKTTVSTSLGSVPNRVSPDTVPTITTACKPLVVLSSRDGIPIVLPNTPTTAMPVVLGVNGNPHGLGLLAQRFTTWVQATKNFDYIDLDVAVKALRIPKRRIYDIVNILEGAGVLQRKNGRKNVFFWAAPLEDNTQEMQLALEQQQDEQLDKWMEMLQSRQKDIIEECNISGPELAPLLGLDTTLLAVHVPQNSFLRTIHTMPFDNNNDAGPIAFKITSHGEPKDFPKACLLTHGETKLHPVEVKTSLSPSKAAFVPYARYPAQSPAIECHDPNPLGTLLKVLPKPPPKAGLSYTDFSPGFQPIEVSDDDEERDASPFVSLWHQDYKEQSRSSFEALLKASEAVCE
jgi:hypothetical protein